MLQKSLGNLLLDTCTMVWLFNDSKISDAAWEAIDEAASRSALLISPISFWEVGMLVAKSRVALARPLRQWVRRILENPDIRQARMDPQVLLDSSFLPGNPPRDPADQIIIATARHHSLTVVTRDRSILDYAAQGHVSALAC